MCNARFFVVNGYCDETVVLAVLALSKGKAALVGGTLNAKDHTRMLATSFHDNGFEAFLTEMTDNPRTEYDSFHEVDLNTAIMHINNLHEEFYENAAKDR